MWQMAGVAIVCCLCHRELMEGGALKKRKRLVISSFAASTFASLTSGRCHLL